MNFIKNIFLNLELLLYFIKELIKANIQVAKAVFVSNNKLNPAIIEIPLVLKSDMGITLLANMITLTPGTLSLDVSKDRKKLYVHVLSTDNYQATIEEIQLGFESRLYRIYG